MVRRLRPLLGAALAVAQPAAEPARVTPAAAAARGLPVGRETMDGFAGERPGRRRFGVFVYAVARAEVAGKAAYLVTMNYAGGGDEGLFQSDTLAVDAATLDPLWHRFHARHDSAAITYRGRHATGWAVREGARRVTVDHVLSPDALDAALLRWVIPALPLAAGYRGAVTTFELWRNAEETTDLTVTGAEPVAVGGRRADAWVVTSGAGVRRWVARETGRLLQEHRAGAAGGRGVWLVRRP